MKFSTTLQQYISTVYLNVIGIFIEYLRLESPAEL